VALPLLGPPVRRRRWRIPPWPAGHPSGELPETHPASAAGGRGGAYRVALRHACGAKAPCPITESPESLESLPFGRRGRRHLSVPSTAMSPPYTAPVPLAAGEAGPFSGKGSRMAQSQRPGPQTPKAVPDLPGVSPRSIVSRAVGMNPHATRCPMTSIADAGGRRADACPSRGMRAKLQANRAASSTRAGTCPFSGRIRSSCSSDCSPQPDPLPLRAIDLAS
jgi:hypothetical protein